MRMRKEGEVIITEEITSHPTEKKSSIMVGVLRPAHS